MIVRPSELSNFCPSPSARKNGMAARLVRGVQGVHVVSEFIETGSDGGHVLPARAKIRSAAPDGHLGHPGPLLVLSRLYDATERRLYGRISDKRMGVSWHAISLPCLTPSHHVILARFAAKVRWSDGSEMPKQGGGQLPPFKGALTARHPKSSAITQQAPCKAT